MNITRVRYGSLTVEHGGRSVTRTVEEWASLHDRAEALQARVDSLMMEYCPDEMTRAQVENWERHQKSVSVEEEARIEAARK